MIKLSNIVSSYGPYGITWDESADTYTRTGKLSEIAVATKPIEGLCPIQSRMRRCLLADNGTVNYYLCPTDSTKKADGVTASVLTGADGQVMVEIPKFWYKHSYAGTTHTWEISSVPTEGFDVHPAFMSGETELNYVYVGAYEASLYDTSTTTYTGYYKTISSHSITVDVDNGASRGTITAATGTPYFSIYAGDVIILSGTTDNDGTYIVYSVTGSNVITCTTVIAGADGIEATAVITAPLDWTATTGDKLSSVSGKLPVTNGTRANFRAATVNRAADWTQELYDIRSAVQLLYLIEYASFYSRSMIGAGISDVTDWRTYNNYYPIVPTGKSNSYGNATCNVGTDAATCAVTLAADACMSYRGIENFYGHLVKWMDGINTNSNRSYICNVVANLADDTATNYTDIGVNNKNSDGYQKTLLNTNRGFLPATVGGSSSTFITNWYYQNTGWRTGYSGGGAYNGESVGAFRLNLYDVSTAFSQSIGGRACFRK